MSVNKKILPSLDEIKQIEKEEGQVGLIRRYAKADVWMGSQDSIDYVRGIIKNHQDDGVLPRQGQV